MTQEQPSGDPDHLSLGSNEHLVLRSVTADAIEVEARYEPGGWLPPVHWHPAQDEHVEVLEGELTVRLNGQQRTVPAGQSFDVAAGTEHQMWNAGATPTRVVWLTTPPLRTQEWFAEVARHRSSGRDGILAMAPTLWRYRHEFRPSGPLPRPVMTGVIALPAGVETTRERITRRLTRRR
ncbi:cupin domain-containing protein [Tersicoccus sp. Bi-70]|uniref:cupin domain-containing protein n=1 Tax=Tersicoccus sp. Bi-70 TaxID=1897634 RepID=UPI000978330B|nr:cupin domain-containing protein [Tersicoccus sp. Bi-70]OMH34987.1 hypothetical protein BGP79_01160 [Tersicoccus sp. Bi-70]